MDISLPHNVAGGIPEGLLITEDFLDGDDMHDPGNNIFIGNGLQNLLIDASEKREASIFVKQVPDPERFGVLKLKNDLPEKIIEKPKTYVSDLAVLGIYFLPINPLMLKHTMSPRGELEIADLLNNLILNGNVSTKELGKEVAWFDAGTPSTLHDVSGFVSALQSKQVEKIACLEK